MGIKILPKMDATLVASEYDYTMGKKGYYIMGRRHLSLQPFDEAYVLGNSFKAFQSPNEAFCWFFSLELRILGMNAYWDNSAYIRPVEYFENHPLLRKVMPLLKERIITCHMTLSQIIELALLMEYHNIDSASTVIDILNAFWFELHRSCQYEKITAEDCTLLNDMVLILKGYKEYNETHDVDRFKKCHILLSGLDLTNLKYKELRISDLVFKYRIKNWVAYYKENPIFFIWNSFMDLYLDNADECRPYEKLCDGMFEEWQINRIVDAEGELNFDSVLLENISPTAVCYIIALDKITSSGKISDRWILNHIDHKYIISFRSLWWECFFYSQNREKYIKKEHETHSFGYQIKYIMDCIELKTGERPKMPKDYFNENNIEISSDTINSLFDVAYGKNTEMADYFNGVKELIIGDDKEEFLSVLHKNIDGKGGKAVAIVLQKAFDEKRLLRFPGESLFMGEFKINTTWEAVRKCLDSSENHIKNSDIHNLAEKFEYQK